MKGDKFADAEVVKKNSTKQLKELSQGEFQKCFRSNSCKTIGASVLLQEKSMLKENKAL